MGGAIAYAKGFLETNHLKKEEVSEPGRLIEFGLAQTL